jgi:hypothetical protein
MRGMIVLVVKEYRSPFVVDTHGPRRIKTYCHN